MIERPAVPLAFMMAKTQGHESSILCDSRGNSSSYQNNKENSDSTTGDDANLPSKLSSMMMMMKGNGVAQKVASANTNHPPEKIPKNGKKKLKWILERCSSLSSETILQAFPTEETIEQLLE